jgi:hypothetical protein
MMEQRKTRPAAYNTHHHSKMHQLWQCAQSATMLMRPMTDGQHMFVQWCQHLWLQSTTLFPALQDCCDRAAGTTS